jgi:hypothetical protein
MLLRHWLLRARVAARGHARGDGRYRGGVQRIRGGGPFEGRQRQFALVQRARRRIHSI